MCFRCLCFQTLTFHNYKSLTSNTFLSYASGGCSCSEYLTVNQRNAVQAARFFVRKRGSQLYRCVFSFITRHWEIRRVSNLERTLIDQVCLASEKYLRVRKIFALHSRLIILIRIYHHCDVGILNRDRCHHERCEFSWFKWRIKFYTDVTKHGFMDRTGIKDSCLFYSVRDWHWAKWVLIACE